MNLNPSRIPRSTYRLQFGPHLTLDAARQLVDYLSELGITDAYASPLFKAREGSAHGYDVIDHAAIDPHLGTPADFQAFAEALRGREMGLLMDVVPNHMGIDDPNNAWWQDVLENGRSSMYAKYFDIDWFPPKEMLHEKVLLPFLGEQYGRAMENQELKLVYEDHTFRIAYYESRYPLAPRSWRSVLQLVVELLSPAMDEEHPERMELESVITALENLSPRTETDPERIRERYREKEVTRRRLAGLYDSSELIRQAMDKAIERFNGVAGDPRSFDRLEALLDEQAYRLSHWRVATDEINYRRFFDINALAAIRVEDPDVFEAVHAMIFRFLKEGWVTGLRIDHPDGLFDPLQYFSELQARCHTLQRPEDADGPAGAPGDARPSLYLVVEKILHHDESLPPDWPVCGTTGYDFMNQLNGLFVARRGVYQMLSIYSRFTGQPRSFGDVLYNGKLTILHTSLASELNVLAGQLDRISEQHRFSRDFTRASLRRALREVIACFPVYRTYIRPESGEVSDADRRRIHAAIRAAKRRNPNLSPSFFDFIGSVLLLEDPDGLTDEQRKERRQWVMKFQQVTGPVTAKGLEDTAFYRFYPLASLNEVGGDPRVPGVPAEEFHRAMAERAEHWPHSISATSTHDTKRGEDVRARLNVLSEIPEDWDQAIRRWHAACEPFLSEIEGSPVPDANEEYLFYQTLVGTWPLEPMDDAARQQYTQRIAGYMEKAMKEAKVNTSWTYPNVEYDEAVAKFVRAVLSQPPESKFIQDLDAFVRTISDAGFTNSLAQLLLKLTAPGVPDFYQGTELWDFSLVDPDNRRPVDFELRRRLLDEVNGRAERDLAELVAELFMRWPDPRIKLLLTSRALAFRRDHAELFSRGRYLPLTIEGSRSEHAFAFAREHEGRWAVCIVPRLAVAAWQREPELVAVGATVEREGSADDRQQPPKMRVLGPPPAAWFSDTIVRLPPETPEVWEDVTTGEIVSGSAGGGMAHAIELADAFRRFPVALLTGREG